MLFEICFRLVSLISIPPVVFPSLIRNLIFCFSAFERCGFDSGLFSSVPRQTLEGLNLISGTENMISKQPYRLLGAQHLPELEPCLDSGKCCH